jgi:hypothetical protein
VVKKPLSVIGATQSAGPTDSVLAQVFKTIKNSDLGDLKCSEITSQKLVAFAKDLTQNLERQTCGNYFSYLSSIFTVARPAWGYPLSRQEFEDSVTVLKNLGLIRKGSERDRRPTLEELDKLLEHFGRIQDPSASRIPSLRNRLPQPTTRIRSCLERARTAALCSPIARAARQG